MLLSNYIAVYAARRDSSRGHVEQFVTHVRCFGEWLGRDATLVDLTTDNVNSHLERMRDIGLSDSYRKSRKTYLIALWGLAADDRLIAPPPLRQLNKINVRDRITCAWTREQVLCQLLPATARLGGRAPRTGTARGAYWRNWILASWESGFRGCDARLIRVADVRRSPRVVMLQKKTAKPIVVTFSQSTRASMLDMVQPGQEYIFELWASEKTWRDEAAMLVKESGLDGSIGKIRASTGTDYELRHPGHGHEFLGDTRAVFEKYYLDLSIVESRLMAQEPLLTG